MLIMHDPHTYLEQDSITDEPNSRNYQYSNYQEDYSNSSNSSMCSMETLSVRINVPFLQTCNIISIIHILHENVKNNFKA